jgi:hypothetical protein
VLPIAISRSAVKVAFVMICLSSSTFAKMIMINPFVCSSQPIIDASPRGHRRILPAR